MKTNQKIEISQSDSDNEWVVFLNGKLFYLAQTNSIKDEESGKVFFESIIPASPLIAHQLEIPPYHLQFEDLVIH